jgi:hypothetical protein
VSAPDRGGIQQSAWARNSWRGSLAFQGGTPPHVGVLTFNPGGVSTCLDLLVDLGDTTMAIGGPDAVGNSIFVYVYAKSDSQQVLVASVELNSFGVSASQRPLTSSFLPAGAANQFIIQSFDVGAMSWSVELALFSLGAIQIDNFFVAGIAHGCEVSILPP